MERKKLKGSLPHVLTDTDAVDDDPSRAVHFSIALEKCRALGAIIISPKEKGGELSTLEFIPCFLRMNFVKVLIPLKGVLKRVPSAVGGDNNPWVAGVSPH
jgi:hypothetical protein